MRTTLVFSIVDPPIELPPITLTISHGKPLPMGKVALGAKLEAHCHATIEPDGQGLVGVGMRFDSEAEAGHFYNVLSELIGQAAADVDGQTLTLYSTCC